MSDEFMFLGLDLIEPSTTNPRKTFDGAKLQELAASIKASGVHQPILVRPLPAARVADTSTDPATGKPRKVRPAYELVCGERRFRASKLAGLDEIPTLIRELSDAQVLEIQIVENLQRDDLAELEEAEGYEALMRHSGLNADQVGEKIGKSRSYVYARLKLLDLTQECKHAMRAGQIDASRALLIARIPDGKLQLKALKYATTVQNYPPEPPSVRTLQNWLKTNVMLHLDGAIFKLTDVRLLESAGSCAECPKRTGANPDLFADVDGADICTDPDCYHGKEEAHRAQLVKKAESRGMRIVQDKEALELLKGNTYRSIPAGYTGLSNQRLDLSKEGERPITLGQALGKDAPAPILFIHPKTQQVSELVVEAEAEAVLLAKGLLQADAHRAAVMQDLEEELQELQEQAKRGSERATNKALDQAVVQAIRQSTTEQAQKLLCGEVLRAWLLCELDNCGWDEMARVCNYAVADGVDAMDAITGHIQRMGDTDLMRMTALSLLDRESGMFGNSTGPMQDAFVKLLGIDTKAIQRAAMATVKREYADRIKAVQAKIDAQKPDLPPAPLAQPQITGGATPKPKGAKGKGKAAAAAHAPKLSEEEAISGIAAAMQGLEQSACAPDGALAPTEGASNNTATAPAGFEVGMQVRVATDTDKLGTFVKKYAGRPGTIRKQEPGGGYWHVAVKPGGVHMFGEDQIERVAA